MRDIDNYFDTYEELLKKIEKKEILKCVELISKTKENDGKLIFIGNGGSAAMASHLSVDFTKNGKIRSLNFNEADLITCYANDFGHDNWMKEALKSYCDKNDLVFFISSSGNSINILNAANWCLDKKINFVTASGMKKDNKLNSLEANIKFYVDSLEYNIVENMTQILLLGILDLYISLTGND